MQMIHPLHAGAARSLRRTPSLFSIEQRVVQSRTRARQQRIVRTALLLLGSSLLICGLLIWRTDNARLRAQQSALDAPVAALQARINELQLLPGSVDENSIRGIQYYSAPGDRFYAMHCGRPCIVGISPKLSLMLRPNGRYVIIYDHGKLHTQWMSMSEYETAIRAQYADMRALEERLQSRPPELP